MESQESKTVLRDRPDTSDRTLIWCARAGEFLHKYFTILLAGLFLLVWANSLRAQSLSGGDFLRQTNGARQAGMGETFAALSGDPNALSYNVAGISDLRQGELSSTYTLNRFDNQNMNLIVGLPVGSGAVAVDISALLGTVMEINNLDGSSETVVSQKDFLVTAGYGLQIMRDASIGLSLKVYSSTLVEEYQAVAFGGDLGILCQNIGFQGFNIGAALQNLGTSIKYVEASDPMPTTLRIGVAYAPQKIGSHGIKTGVDVMLPNDGDPAEHLGLEYAWRDLLFGRIGCQLEESAATLTFGGGVRLDGIRLDYAFVKTDLGGDLHRLELGYAFGTPAAPRSANPR